MPFNELVRTDETNFTFSSTVNTLEVKQSFLLFYQHFLNLNNSCLDKDALNNLFIYLTKLNFTFSI